MLVGNLCGALPAPLLVHWYRGHAAWLAIAALVAANAFGATAAQAQIFTVTNTNDSGTGSLRAAITAADAANGGTIVFSSSLAGQTIVAGSGTNGPLPVINTTGTVTIDGSAASGLTISGNNTNRVFFVLGGNATIENLAIANGRATGGAGGLGAGGGGMGAGGAIFVNAGTTTVSNFVFSNNSAVGGAGGAGGANLLTGGGGGGLGGNGGGGAGFAAAAAATVEEEVAAAARPALPAAPGAPARVGQAVPAHPDRQEAQEGPGAEPTAVRVEQVLLLLAVVAAAVADSPLAPAAPAAAAMRTAAQAAQGVAVGGVQAMVFKEEPAAYSAAAAAAILKAGTEGLVAAGAAGTVAPQQGLVVSAGVAERPKVAEREAETAPRSTSPEPAAAAVRASAGRYSCAATMAHRSSLQTARSAAAASPAVWADRAA